MKRTLSLLSVLVSVVCFSQQPMFNKQGHGNRVIVTPPPPLPGTFTLTSAASTSAGVYQNDGTDDILVRMLWGNVSYTAGTYPIIWDGKNDNSNYLPDGNYKVKVQSNNITHEWGLIGNSSDQMTGSSIHHWPEAVKSMVNVGSYNYFCVGYNEGHSSQFKFSLSAPNTNLNYGNLKNMSTAFAATDGTRIYHAGFLDEPKQGVYATNVSDDSPYTFSTGVPVQARYGSVYPSVIDIVNSTSLEPGQTYTQPNVGGMAVQKNGSYLFVSYFNLNEIHVIDKITGALVQTITSFANPTKLAIDGNDNLWVTSGTNTVARYNVNSNGTLGLSTLNISGLVKPIAIAVSPDNTTLAVADGGARQQVRFFNTTNATEGTPLGQLGGYANDPNVANDKFMWRNMKELLRDEMTFICYIPDGSFWIGDQGNCRTLHFSSSKTLLETISNVGYHYDAKANTKNISRVFANYLEFNVDWTKTLGNGANGAWTLVKNWAYPFTPDFDAQGARLTSVTTLSNGRTYALAHHQPAGTGLHHWQVVELPSTGNVRFSGVDLVSSNQNFDMSFVMNDDGSLLRQSTTALGSTSSWLKKSVTGFDTNGFPVWGNEVVIAGTPTILAKDPISESGLFPNQFTSTNKIIGWSPDSYTPDNSPRANGYHLGAVKLGTSKWLWKASNSTFRFLIGHNGGSPIYNDYRGDFPSNGDYDIGNGVGYAGSFAAAIDNFILWGYHGEFYKGGQTNKWNVFSDIGLPLHQMGAVSADTRGQEGVAELAGNALTGTLIKLANGDLGLISCDESQHGALQAWKIKGMNTVQVQTVSITKSGNVAPALDYVDLMAGLPYASVLVNNTAGWTRDPVDDVSSGSFGVGDWSIKTNLLTYKTTDRDLAVHSSPSSNGTTQNIYRDLGNNNTTHWTITGSLAYQEAFENGNNFTDILDANNKVIVRISRPNTGNYPFMFIKANNAVIVQDDLNVIYNTMNRLQPLNIDVNGNVVTVSLANYPTVTTTIFDPTADATKPKTLRVQFYSPSNNGFQIDLANLRLYTTASSTTTTSTSPPVYVPEDKIIPIPAGKLTYYISNTGSVSNSGTDSLHPWPLSKVQAYTTLPNNIAVLFHRGETFTGTMASGSTFYPTVAFYSNTSASPIDSTIYDAYGAGAKPILTPMNTFPGSTIAGNWRQVAGLTNVWVINLPVLLNYTPRMWLNGIEYQRAKDSTQVNATKRTCFRNADFEMMYVYSPGGNPATAYTSITSASFSKSTIDIGGQNLVAIRNLDIRGSEGASLDLTFNKNVLVENCIIGRDGNREGMRNNGVSNITVRNNLFSTGEINKQDFNIATEGGDGMIFGQNGARNVEAYGNYYENYRHVGYSIECDTQDSVVNVRYHHNYVTAPNVDYGRGFAVYYYKGLNVKMDHNTYRNIPIQNQLAADGFVDEYNRYDSIRNNTYMDFGTGGALSIGHSYFTAKNMTFQYDTITNCESFGIELVAPKQGATGTDVSFCTFRGNILQNNGYNNLATITAPEYYPQNTDFIIRESPTGQSHVYIHDNNYLNNNFNRSNPEPPIYYAQAANGTILNTVSQFQTNLTNADVATGNLVNTSYNYPIVTNTTYVPAIFNIELKSTDKWIDDGTGGYTSTDGTQGYATSRNNASYSTPFELLATYTGAINQGAYVGFDTFWNLVGYFGWAFAVEVDATGRYYAQNNAANETSTGVVAQAGDLYGLRKYEDGTIVAGYYRSGTWNVLKTFTLKLSTGTTYAKVHTLAGKKLQNPKLRRERSNFGSRTVFNIGSLP